jgi:hypothetical protein
VPLLQIAIHVSDSYIKGQSGVCGTLLLLQIAINVTCRAFRDPRGTTTPKSSVSDSYIKGQSGVCGTLLATVTECVLFFTQHLPRAFTGQLRRVMLAECSL